MNTLVLRLEGPLMSFGGPIVDRHGLAQRFPAKSMVVGLIANALGWDHRDAARISELQSRLEIASRLDREGRRLIDYQTVDLGQEHLVDTGWTTRGIREDRDGGSGARTGTHIRLREYRADACCTIAISVTDEGRAPTLDQISDAIRNPERPVYLGRKCCVPTRPVFEKRTESPSLRAVLELHPVEAGGPTSLPAQWPAAEGEGAGTSRVATVTDERDWPNQVHCGERRVREGLIKTRAVPR